MKNIIKQLSIPLAVLAFSACEKVENKVYYEGGTAPVVSLSTTNVQLEPGQEAENALTISWTNPDYKFTTGVSSHDVTYTIEIDTVGGNFRSGAKFTTVIGRNLSVTYSVGQLNAILGNTMLLQLDPRRNYNLEARVTSSIGNALKMVSSNKVSFTARPFPPPPKVTLPPNDRLFIVGDATPGGWNVIQAQQMTRVSRTLYEITLNVPGGGFYKLIPADGAWGQSYRIDGSNSEWNQGSFRQQDTFDGGIPGPPTTGRYKFSFNFQIGRYDVVRQ